VPVCFAWAYLLSLRVLFIVSARAACHASHPLAWARVRWQAHTVSQAHGMPCETPAQPPRLPKSIDAYCKNIVPEGGNVRMALAVTWAVKVMVASKPIIDIRYTHEYHS